MKIMCAACGKMIEGGRIDAVPFARWGMIAILALALVVGIGIGKAASEEIVDPSIRQIESLDAFAYQVTAQGFALRKAQADRCVRKYKFGALMVHDGCIFEVANWNAPFPQFEVCRDKKGEPVCSRW